jgi:hypothetical protein
MDVGAAALLWLAPSTAVKDSAISPKGLPTSGALLPDAVKHHYTALISRKEHN